MFELLNRRIYESAPLLVKRLCSMVPYAVIAGRNYRKTLCLCRQSDGWSREEVVAYQEHQLGRLLQFVADEVPFYQKYRLTISKHDPFNVLQELPIISKLTIQEHFQEFIPRSISSITHRVARTSGSSGNQMEFLEDASTYSREMAYMHSQWRRVGYTTHCRKATFRVVTIEKPKAGVFWQINPIHNELQFSPFHMSERNLGAYVQRFVEYRPEFVHGYPSTINVFAEYLLRNDLAKLLAPIKGVLLCSEACLPDQRSRIAGALRSPIYTWYGQSERVILGGECECSQFYHVFPSYGFLEVLADNGSRCQIGKEGEIVGTGFLNWSMPLIRYRTDDYAVLQESVCECGRQWDRFSDVRGRRSIEGYVIGKSGAKISSIALEPPFGAFRNVVRFQYYQNKPGKLRLRILPNPHYTAEDERKIIGVHESRLFGEMDIIIDLVKDIPLTARGKQRLIISEIPENASNHPTTQIR